MIDLQAITPYQVQVTFPKVVDGVDQPTLLWVETVVLTSFGLTEYNGIVGLRTPVNTTKTFHSNARANFVSPGSTPTNATEIANLAKRIARDFYLYRLGYLDRKYPNILAWDMEGLSDCVEWVYRLDEVSTRVQRPSWNDLTEELGHLSSVIPPIPGTSGTLTVREVDLSPTVMMVTILTVDQADGFVVSTPAAGEARLDLAEATATQRGIVSLTDQTMGAGDKSFVNRILLTSAGAGEIDWLGHVTNYVAAVDVRNDDNGNLHWEADLIGPTSSYFLRLIRHLAGAPDADAGLLQLLTSVTDGRFCITDASGSYFGIHGTSLLSVNVHGGLVVGGSGTLTLAQSNTLLPIRRSWLGI